VCYFIPALFNTFNIISGETSSLYNIASRYLLPASLVLLTLSINFAALKLGSKSYYYVLAGTLGIIIGGPLALYIVGSFYPEVALSNGKKFGRTIDNSRKLDWWRRKSNRHARSIWRKQKHVAQMIAVMFSSY
jgi:hypothetical protein